MVIVETTTYVASNKALITVQSKLINMKNNQPINSNAVQCLMSPRCVHVNVLNLKLSLLLLCWLFITYLSEYILVNVLAYVL